MRAAQRVVLSVGKREILLVGCDVGMGESAFEVAFLDVDDGVGATLNLSDFTCQKVEQTVFGMVFLAVEYEGEPAVEESVVPHHLIHVFHKEVVIAEQFGIGHESYLCAVFLIGRNYIGFRQQFAF